MDVVPFLNLRTKSLLEVNLDLQQRCDLRRLFGEELYGEPIETRKKPFVKDTYFDYELPAVSAGDVFGDKREWTVVDTAFGRRYLSLADFKGGFILLSLLPTVADVLVEFDRPVPTDHPSRHADNNFNPVQNRNRRQYIMFLSIAAGLVAESEQQQS